jgi:hypothetical protein
MMSPSAEFETTEHLNPVAARMMLAAFPEHIRSAIERRAKEIDYPVEAVLEMAIAQCLCKRIAGFLDGESLSCLDCKSQH